MDIERIYGHYLACGMEVTTDSRQIKEGALFFALVGDKFDGNDYALAALEKGAKYAVVSRPELAENPRCLLVEDTLKTLQELATYHRDQIKPLKVIAITGTNGKTTTKELLAAILTENRVPTLYTEGNLNNHIGVPLTLLRLRPEHCVAVIEMGASKPGDIKELAEIAHPNTGLITNIGVAHLEGFGSQENILNTKSELFDYLRAHKGDIILNAGDPLLWEKWQNRFSLGYQLGFTDDLRIISGDITESANPYLSMVYYENGLYKAVYPIHTNLVGRYNASNVMAAIILARRCRIDPINAIYAISNFVPSNNRSQLIRGTRGRRLIVDAYNANPSSMREAINNLSLMDSEHYCLILGDMMELGEASEEAHLQVINWLIDHPDVEAYLCGPEFDKHREELCEHNEETPYFFTNSADELLDMFQLWPRFDDNTTILLKGSHSMHLEKLIPILTKMIND